MSTVTPEAQSFANHLRKLYTPEEIKKALAELRVSPKELHQYRDDPAGFGIDVLGEYYTPDIIKVMESVRDNRITIARSANSTGKSHMAGRVAIWFYQMWEDAQVYTAAAPPERNLRRLLWGEIGSASSKKPELFVRHESQVMRIFRPPKPPATEPKSFIEGVTIPTTGSVEQREARFAGKHAPHLLFIVDEGDAVPDEVYKGIESCMSGSHDRLLILLNPRMKSGTPWRYERDGKAQVIGLSAFNHPNVIYGEERLPGAVSREITVKRINEWTRPLAEGEQGGDNCFEVPQFLVGAIAESDKHEQYPPLPAGWRVVEDPEFYYMVLGIYSPQAVNQLISEDWINNARARWDAYVAVNGKVPPQGVSGIHGQDVAEFGPDSNVACFRYGGWVDTFVAWSGMDTDAVADESYQLYKSHRCTKAFVDGNGLGANVAPKMSRLGATAVGVKVGESPTTKVEQGEFAQLRDQLYWMVRDWLRNDPGAMLPPDEMLIEELMVLTYSHTTKHRKIKVMTKAAMKDRLKRSPDRLDSLALTFAPTGGWSVGVAQIGR
jgi:hypothetical protein